MKRRDFITLLSGAVAAWPLAARAQQLKSTRRIAAMLSYPESAPEGLQRIKLFEQTLENLGWTGPRKLQIDYYWNINTIARANEAVSNLLKLSPEVIFAGIGQALIAAKAATETVPIVFVAVSEPVNRGFVQSLSHPGRNITGFTNMEPTIGPKWLQLLKDIAPAVTRVAIVFNPETGAALPFFHSVETAAKMFGVEAAMLLVHSPAEITTVIQGFAQQPNGGLISLPDGFSPTHRELFVEATARFKVPAIYPTRTFTDAGGLISYAPDFVDQYRLAASYVDRILRGEKPADLPVQQPTKFELIINLKTANALGLSISREFLLTADEVIE
jgi:putative ABC transport system substrate-binding protein